MTKHQHKFERHLKHKHGQSTPKAEHIHNHNPKLECYDKTKFIDTNLSVEMAPRFQKRECSILQCQFCGITKIDHSNLRVATGGASWQVLWRGQCGTSWGHRPAGSLPSGRSAPSSWGSPCSRPPSPSSSPGSSPPASSTQGRPPGHRPPGNLT